MVLVLVPLLLLPPLLLLVLAVVVLAVAVAGIVVAMSVSSSGMDHSDERMTLSQIEVSKGRGMVASSDQT